MVHDEDLITSILCSLNTLYFKLMPCPFLKSLTLPLTKKYIWNLTSNGNSTTKSTYHFIHKLSNHNYYRFSQPETTNLSWIWKSPCHPRENFFLWQIYMKSLPTNTKLLRENCIGNSLYPQCQLEHETHLHALRDFTVPMLKAFGTPFPLPNISLIKRSRSGSKIIAVLLQ